jgi:hypothetical protein
MGEELSDSWVTLKEAMDVVYRARHGIGDRGITRSASRTLDEWLADTGGIGGVLRSLAGVTNGILDFKNVDDEEVMDTLDPTFRSGDTFLKVHRRTLISIGDTDRSLEEFSDTAGISPYVMLPHCVVVHNEELIDRVMECLDAFENSSKIEKLEMLNNVCRNAMRGMYVPNLFNYVTEKTLYDRAFEIRGSEEIRRLNLVRMRELEQRLTQAYERRRSWSDAVVQILLLLLTLTQVTVIFLTDIPKTDIWPAIFGSSTIAIVGVILILLWRR